MRGATEHNLKNVDAEVPLNRLVCVTGVSGSGKSTLVQDVLYNALLTALGKPKDAPGAHAALEGFEPLTDVVLVDQSPIGRTTRSNPASFVGVLEPIRKLFANEPLARERGYTAGTFSFNSGNGRCPACSGLGFEHVEMQFLSDVYLRCADCNGRRYRTEVLDVRIALRAGGDAKSIADVLDMTVADALDVLRQLQGRARAPAAARRRGPRLPHARPARADAVGRGGAAPEARGRARGSGRRRQATDAVPVRRADHGPALLRHRQAPRRARSGSSTPAIR